MEDLGEVSGVDAQVPDQGGADAGAQAGLPLQHAFEPARAMRGAEVLPQLQGATLPWLAFENLWVVWGQFGLSDAEYWEAFALRYGMVAKDEGGPPYGIVQNGGQGTIQCLACHVDRVAGEVMIGAGNGRLLLGRLYEDLNALAEIAPQFGIAVPPIPQIWHDAFADRTGGPGATDAFGMGMTLATAFDPNAGVQTRYGFQQPPAWWQMAYKDRTYTDGAGTASNHRTMMATSLASGAGLSQLQAQAEDFENVQHYLRSLRAPSWPFDAPATAMVEAGAALFSARCADCHGIYEGPNAAYPERIEEVGTDPVRSARFTATEAQWINQTWFGQPPMEANEGYLAPPLVGVWATAPYLHNGSVPDLRALLLPSERPVRWRRLAGPEDYDPQRVGVRWEEGPSSDPNTYDTEVEGLSAQGHLIEGEPLSPQEVEALLAYLVTL